MLSKKKQSYNKRNCCNNRTLNKHNCLNMIQYYCNKGTVKKKNQIKQLYNNVHGNITRAGDVMAANDNVWRHGAVYDVALGRVDAVSAAGGLMTESSCFWINSNASIPETAKNKPWPARVHGAHDTQSVRARRLRVHGTYENIKVVYFKGVTEYCKPVTDEIYHIDLCPLL